MSRPSVLLAALLMLSATALQAQQMPVPSEHPAVRAALEHITRVEPETVEEQIALCEVPAPPFLEQERAAVYRRHFEALGLETRIDAEGNVIAVRPGEPGEPTVMLSGHLDTVFPEGTDVTVRREGSVLHGPGIGDDCRGLAVVLAVARALDAADVQTRGTILFVGTVGEEGQGNLRGVRHLFEQELKDQVDYFISVDGAGLDAVKDAVGSYRYTVTFRGPGGHSYGAFGTPSPIHALGRAIDHIAELQTPRDPKTTFNVGVIEGGTSVNSIAYEASMEVDLRSEDPDALDAVDREFRAAVARAVREENARWPESGVEITAELDRWGLRPAGRQSADAPIVGAVVASAAELGFTPRLGASSTDANLPMSLGIPSVTVDGGGSGSGAHSLDESFDTAGSEQGSRWALLLALTLAGVR